MSSRGDIRTRSAGGVNKRPLARDRKEEAVLAFPLSVAPLLLFRSFTCFLSAPLEDRRQLGEESAEYVCFDLGLFSCKLACYPLHLHAYLVVGVVENYGILHLDGPSYGGILWYDPQYRKLEERGYIVFLEFVFLGDPVKHDAGYLLFIFVDYALGPQSVGYRGQLRVCHEDELVAHVDGV